MLRVQNTSSQKAIRYFRQKPEQKKGYRCLGAGARELGIEGEIEVKEFENLMQGLSPDGSKHLSSRAIAPEKRRAVLECLFCASKSVSIQALPGGDRQLLEAQMRAVELTVGQIEQEYVGARITIDGERSFVKTGNLIAIAIDHPESRSLDPHVHTHCLIVNATQSPTNGKWYALSNEQILADQQYLGLQYRHHLALEVQKLGYEIQLQEGGQFEIVGYSRPQLLASSQRQQQTLELAPENPTWEQRNTARLLTRSSKQHICEEELVRNQRARLQELEISFVTPGQPHPDLKGTTLTPQILEEAIAHCSEYQVAFRRQDLEKYILSEYLTCDLSGLNDLIKQNAELIRTPETNRVRYTTRDALARERATIRLMQEGQGAVKALTSTEAIAVQLGQTDLNPEQQQAVKLTATTTDRFIAWQGVAGAGKTYALKEVLPLLTERGYSVKALAPSAQAAKILGEELQVEAQTVDLLLASNLASKDPTPQYWIVDEAGLVGAKDGFELLQRATREGARILFVGDSKQLSAVQAGNPFKSLQQAGIQTAYLNESRRQRHNPELKAAVDAIASGEIVAGFNRLQANECIQTVAASEKVEAIVRDYMRSDKAVRAETLVLAGTHVEREAMTSGLRSALKAEGSLGEEDIATTQLKAKNLTLVQLNKLNHFVPRDFIVPLRDYKRRGLKKGEIYEVAGVSLDRVNLKTSDGEILTVDPDFKKSLYQAQQVGIAVGDRLRWTRNDRTLGRRNGQEFTVEAIDGSVATIAYNDGKKESLDLSRPQHLDYALVSTIYSSQGKTARRVLVSCDRTIHKESFYVAASRPTHELKLYTDSPQELLELASRSRSKETVAEALLPPAPINATSIAQIKRNYARGTSSPVKIAPTRVPPPIIRPPLPKEPFWSPSVPLTPPARLSAVAWQELVEKSVIHPAIAQLNFRSLKEDSIEKTHEAWEYLFYSANLDRTNTGQLVSGILKRYRHIENGGWWCGAGVNPLSFSNLKPGEQPAEKLWGCFKPNTPRVDRDKPGKIIKYEHPLKTQRSIFLLHVPEEIAERIYQKEQIHPSPDDRQRGFWYCAWKYNLPVTITEGAKKAACLLSQGHVAIGLPGIYAGYYSKDERGYPIPPRLHEELAVFATPGRQVTFCFDYETKPKTICNIDIAIARTGSLMQSLGCKARKVTLPGPEKGVDDFVRDRGPLAYEDRYRVAKPLPVLRGSFYHGGNRDRSIAEAFNRNDEKPTPSRVRTDSSSDRQQQQFTRATSEHFNPNRDVARIVREYVATTQRRGERRQIERIAGDFKAITRNFTEIVAAERSYLSILHKLHGTTAALERKYLTNAKPIAAAGRECGTDTNRVSAEFATENLISQTVEAIVERAQCQAIVRYPGLVEAIEQLTTQLDTTITAQIQFERILEQSCQQRHELEIALAPDNNRRQVKINTTNPLLQQYNGQTGEVLKQIKLGRMEQAIVKIGDVTPTFSPSDLEIILAAPQPVESQSQNVILTASSEVSLKLKLTQTPNHEPIDSQQSQQRDRVNIGSRTSEVFHFNDNPTRSDRSSERSNREQLTSNNHSAEERTDDIGTTVKKSDRGNEQTATDKQARVERAIQAIGETGERHFKTTATSSSQRQQIRALVNSVRTIPLETVAERLGFERDRYSGEWKREGSAIAIDGREFFDRAVGKKGRGAIELVAQIRGTSLKESLVWLSDLNLVNQSPATPTQTELTLSLPKPQENEWMKLREYFVETLGLSAREIDDLHQAGSLYATDAGAGNINAVFLHRNSNQKVTGATILRGGARNNWHEVFTNNDLETGCFSLNAGSGKPKRVVLTQNPLQALTLAATERADETQYIATSSVRTVLFAQIEQLQAPKVKVEIAYPGDRAGEITAWEVARLLPNAVRIMPVLALVSEQASLFEWQLVARSIGKAEAEIQKVTEIVNHSQAAWEKIGAATASDFDTYNQTSSDLWQWYAAAQRIGKSVVELNQIADCAIAFHHPTHPVPLSEPANEAMRHDLHKAIIAKLQQLSDRELVTLDRTVKNYFSYQPLPPPAERVRSLQLEVDRLNEQLCQLRQQQGQSLNRHCDKTFEEIKIEREIERVFKLKQRKERLSEEFNKREKTYQVWKNIPKTVELQRLEQALQLPQIQEKIQQELKQHYRAIDLDNNRGKSL